MNLLQAAESAFRNYAVFRGRARRREYWLFMVFNDLVYLAAVLLGVLIYQFEENLGQGIVFFIPVLYYLGTIVPSLSLHVRRLHDVGKSGSYLFFLFLPIVGSILLLVWAFEDGQPYTNQYGDDPKGRRINEGRIYCSHCGKLVDAYAPMCPYCGYSINTHADIHKVSATKPVSEPIMEPVIKAEPTPVYSTSDRVCTTCGRYIPEGNEFCPYCKSAHSTVKIKSSVVKSASPTTPTPTPAKGFYSPTDLD